VGRPAPPQHADKSSSRHRRMPAIIQNLISQGINLNEALLFGLPRSLQVAHKVVLVWGERQPEICPGDHPFLNNSFFSPWQRRMNRNCLVISVLPNLTVIVGHWPAPRLIGSSRMTEPCLQNDLTAHPVKQSRGLPKLITSHDCFTKNMEWKVLRPALQVPARIWASIPRAPSSGSPRRLEGVQHGRRFTRLSPS